MFADCAINIAPDSQDLAEIAIESANTAQMFDIDPRVAMLSFSTKGSAKSDETDKVAEAVKIAKEKRLSLRLTANSNSTLHLCRLSRRKSAGLRH